MARPKILSGFLTVGAWTLASRVLGFVRDIMIAAALGTGPVAEAFLIAFSLPNMFRRFFGEGTLNPAFVPMFSRKLEVEGHKAAENFARDALSGLGFFLIIFTVIAQVFMPLLVLAMASGFVADDRFDLTVLFGRIAFPYILFIAIAALLSGVLNATGRFMASAAARRTSASESSSDLIKDCTTFLFWNSCMARAAFPSTPPCWSESHSIEASQASSLPNLARADAAALRTSE